MDCTVCKTKKCRSNEACSAVKFDSNSVLNEYDRIENQRIVKAAAMLVDNGRAGTLSRLQEIVEYIKNTKIGKVGIAYCYGMENDIKLIATILKNKRIKVVPVSCTTGGMAQCEVNNESDLKGVSCNPIAQAKQLNEENVDLTLVAGLCLGHDILFQRYIESDTSTLIVKDRVHDHNPLQALRNN